MKIIDENNFMSTMDVVCLGIRYEQTGCGKKLQITPKDVLNDRSEAYIVCPVCRARTFVKPSDMSAEFYAEWIKLKH